MMKMHGLMTAGFVACLLWSSVAAADMDVVTFVDLDNRYATPGKEGTVVNEIERLEYTGGIASYFSYESFGAMLDLKLITAATPDEGKIGPFLHASPPRRFFVETDAAYLEFFDVGMDGIDVRVGRQIVEWGSADMFNPTSVVNALDLEDPLKFGKRVPNEMASITWNAPWSLESAEGDLLFDELTVSFTVIPSYRPSLLPRTGEAAFTDPSLMDVQVDSAALREMARLNDAFKNAGGALDFDLHEQGHDYSAESMQYAARVSATVSGVNLAAMYYRGFSDVVYADDVSIGIAHTTPSEGEALNAQMKLFDLSDSGDVDSLIGFIDQDIGGIRTKLADASVTTTLVLKNPEIQMLGAEMSTSLDSLGGLGVWAEAAYFMHEDLQRHVDAGKLEVLEDIDRKESFLKLTVGMDYTIAKWWYVNVQYMHGFVDEFGSERLNDYIVGVNDFKLMADKLLIRFVVMRQAQDGSMTVLPQLTTTYWDSTELTLGGLAYIGEKVSKFGTPAAGPNLAFLRARFSF